MYNVRVMPMMPFSKSASDKHRRLSKQAQSPAPSYWRVGGVPGESARACEVGLFIQYDSDGLVRLRFPDGIEHTFSAHMLFPVRK